MYTHGTNTLPYLKFFSKLDQIFFFLHFNFQQYATSRLWCHCPSDISLSTIDNLTHFVCTKSHSIFRNYWHPRTTCEWTFFFHYYFFSLNFRLFWFLAYRFALVTKLWMHTITKCNTRYEVLLANLTRDIALHFNQCRECHTRMRSNKKNTQINFFFTIFLLRPQALKFTISISRL